MMMRYLNYKQFRLRIQISKIKQFIKNKTKQKKEYGTLKGLQGALLLSGH